MTTKPQPLDLEDLKEFAPNLLAKNIMDMIIQGLTRNEKIVDTKEDAIELTSDLINEIVDEIKQRLKSACEFYLKYKDNPELLIEEQKKYYDNLEDNPFLIAIFDTLNRSKIIDKFDEKECGWKLYEKEKALKEYNDWLFKLAFKDVFEK